MKKLRMTIFRLCCGVWQKFTNVSEVLAASITRVIIMVAESTSETSVNFCYTALHKNPKDTSLHV
jgi:hypothetical protein